MDTRSRAPGSGTLEPTRGPLEGEGRFLQITQALQDVVVLCSSDFRQLLFVNAAYERIWGRLRSELYANPLAFLDGVHPEDRDRVWEALRNQPADGVEMEFRVVRPEGDQRWVWVRTFPVRGRHGDVYRFAGVAEDITERKQVLESHARLIRGFTHDVKNPLGAADGLLTLLEMGLHGPLSERQTDTVRRARRGIRTAIDLIAQLLDIERAQSGQLQIVRDRFDLGDAVRDVVSEFASAAHLKSISLQLVLPAEKDALLIYSDRARVRQIIANLVSNGVKYTQAGGRVSVQVVSVAEGEAPRAGQWLAVVVDDNGPGIPADKQHLLFREFTRFNPTAAEGSGVGLAISEKLATALDGAITFKSSVEVGSVFTLWLPIDRRQSSTD